MNVSDIITYVKRQFGDESGVQVVDDDIIRWINAAQRDAILYNESLLKTTGTIDIVADQQEYTLPADLYILRSLRVKFPDWTSYISLEGVNLQDFDRLIGDWDGAAHGTGKTYVYSVHDRSIFLFPVPDQDSVAGIKLLYSAFPAEILTISDPIELPEQYHNAILKYCMHQATILDEDLEASAVHQTQFISDMRILSYQDEYGAHETYPSISVRADDAW